MSEIDLRDLLDGYTLAENGVMEPCKLEYFTAKFATKEGERHDILLQMEKLIEKGWQPVGGTKVNIDDVFTWHLQAMVRVVGDRYG